MKGSKKPRMFLALYHRDRLSLPPHREELGLASFHWALLITPMNGVEDTHLLDVTDAMQIDPVRYIDTNPDRNWIFRDMVGNPLSNIRLVVIAMIGKLKLGACGLEKLIQVLKKECRVPRKNAAGENCVWWVKEVVKFLQGERALRYFDIHATFQEAQLLATERIGSVDIARKRTEVINFTNRACDISFGT